MADKKGNDFWGKSDDDFWNKPVITGDWLNNKNDQDTSHQEEPTYGIPNQPAYTYQRNENYKEQRKGQTIAQSPGTKKKFPIFLMINLLLIAFTLIVVSVCILTASAYRKNAEYRNRQLDYESVVVIEDSFPVYDNNTVTLAYEACVVFSQDTDKQLLGMPEGEMLIAVPVQVKSEKYQSEQYALRDMYIGCAVGEQMVFRRCIRDETIWAALAQMGFQREEMLSAYGIGNGIDGNGFFFFFVPENTQNAILFMEERKTEHQVSVLTRRYEKEFVIVNDTDGQEWLREIKESEGWR